MRFWTAFAVALFLPAFVSASTCAIDGYKYTCSCSQGKFDSSGKVDSTCNAAGQAQVISCMTLSHPEATAKYLAKKCPALENCINKLKGCTGSMCTGSDQTNCANTGCQSCYVSADDCGEKAAVNCQSACGDGVCDKEHGEDSTNCCQDCECSGQYYCGDSGSCKRMCSAGAQGIIERLNCTCFILPLISLMASLVPRLI